jgi:hypothetical protein
MTDKQIIIDGVDVSECGCIIQDYQRANNIEGRYEHIKNVCELGERSAEYYNLFCKDNSNCYYKQLKRKEQECEELKKQRQADKGLITSTGKINHQLLQEYDELKTENDECIKDNEYLKTIIKDFTQEVVKLKQTLTEIKEIAITGLEGFCPKCSRKECEDNNCIETAIRDILQKISEVVDEDS